MRVCMRRYRATVGEKSVDVMMGERTDQLTGLNEIINDLGFRMQEARIQPEFGAKWSIVAGSFIVGTVEQIP